MPSDLRVAIQGGPGSWSEESLIALLPRATVVRCATVQDAWRRCLSGDASAAWLASSNTLVGDIVDTRFVREAGDALAELAYPIRHALLALPGVTLHEVDRVEAHPYALSQCKASLARLVPHAQLVATVDGAHSATLLERGSKTAVVASPKLAEGGGLRLLAEGIADTPDNATTFRLLVPR